MAWLSQGTQEGSVGEEPSPSSGGAGLASEQLVLVVDLSAFTRVRK